MFAGETDGNVVFDFRTRSIVAEVMIPINEDVIRDPPVESIEVQLSDKGFLPPDKARRRQDRMRRTSDRELGRMEPTFLSGQEVRSPVWRQEFDHVEPATLADLTEWVFVEIFGERQNFIAQVEISG